MKKPQTKRKDAFLFKREHLEWLEYMCGGKYPDTQGFYECIKIIAALGLDGDYEPEISQGAHTILSQIMPQLIQEQLARQTKPEFDDNGILIPTTARRIPTQLQLETWHENGKYGHLGGRPKLGENPRKPYNNPRKTLDPPPHFSETDPTLSTDQTVGAIVNRPPESKGDEAANLKTLAKQALERSALGYTIPVMQTRNAEISRHIPPNIKALKIILDDSYVPSEQAN